MKTLFVCVAVAAFFGGASVETAWANEVKEGAQFWRKDWEVVCDNTLTCRMAGYSVENSEKPVSVLITRAAGADTPLQGQVQLYSESETLQGMSAP